MTKEQPDIRDSDAGDREIVAIRDRLARLDTEKIELEARLTRLFAEQEIVTERSRSIEAAPVTNASSPAEKIALFRSLFRGRDDVFPKRWENTKTGKAGYAPTCANEWAPRICGKPKVKCGNCPNHAFLPVTDEVIDGHLRGRHTIGVYPMLADETCWFLAADFDKATWRDDVASVKPGGLIIHEAVYPVSGEMQRDDVTYFAVPFAEMGKKHVTKAELRKYLINMIYVGVLGELLGIDEATIEAAVSAQFRKKPAAVETNMHAVRLGFEYARAELSKQDLFRLERISGKTEGTTFFDGNRAAALGCIMGGCTVAAWYPITPSSSLCEAFIQYAERYRVDPKTGEHRVAIVQAEDELAAAGIVFGAGWAGARAMTSTSGPGE